MDFYFRDDCSCRVSAAAFTQIGIERALRNEVGTESFYFLLEYFFVYAPHCHALIAHVSMIGERREELVCRIHHLQFYPRLIAKIFLYICFVVRPINSTDVHSL